MEDFTTCTELPPTVSPKHVADAYAARAVVHVRTAGSSAGLSAAEAEGRIPQALKDRAKSAIADLQRAKDLNPGKYDKVRPPPSTGCRVAPEHWQVGP
jgi:hypothetical protein